MSDCFDHELDAHEQHLHCGGDSRSPGYSGGTRIKDHDYYHSALISLKVVAETDKAMLLEYEGFEKWIPKSQLRIHGKGNPILCQVWLKAVPIEWKTSQ